MYKIINASTKEALIGASIFVEGVKDKGTITDLDGNFTLNLRANQNVINVSSDFNKNWLYSSTWLIVYY